MIKGYHFLKPTVELNLHLLFKKVIILPCVKKRCGKYAQFLTISRIDNISINNFKSFSYYNYVCITTTGVLFKRLFSSDFTKVDNSKNVFLVQAIGLNFESLKNAANEESKEVDTFEEGELGMWCSSETTNNGNKIFVKHAIHDVISVLCHQKDSKSIVANIIFFVLHYLNVKNVKTVDEYKENITQMYSSLIKCYDKIFKSANSGEYIFGLFNDELVKIVSPSLKRNKKGIIYDIILNSLDFYFKNNIDEKEKLNINMLCEIITYKNFFYVMNSIHYDIPKFKEKLDIFHLDYLFCNFLNDANYLKDAIQLASVFYSDLFHMNTPFKKGCSFTPFSILNKIIQIQSKNFFFLFLNSISCDHFKMEVLSTLLSADTISGFMPNFWGYLSAKEYLFLEDIQMKNESTQLLVDTKNIRTQVEKHEGKVCKEEESESNALYSISNCIKDTISVLTSIEEIEELLKEIKEEQTQHWKMYIYDNDKLFNISTYKHFSSGNDLNTYLKNEKKLFYVGIDTEWNKHKKLSIISLATERKIYIIDVLHMNYKCKAFLCNFFLWLLENPFICKLFYNFSSDIQIISLYFKQIRKITTFSNIVDLKDPIIITDVNEKEYNKKTENMEAFYLENWNKEIIESGDISMFKAIAKNTFHNINKKIRNNCSEAENIVINYIENKKKIYFKSLNDLCKNILKKELNKSIQNCNWDKRPLTAQQITYVAVDAHVLIELEKQLLQRNYFSACFTNSNQLMMLFLQKFNNKNCDWEDENLKDFSVHLKKKNI